jgi:PAS domain S-box-containing protein
MPTLPLYQRLEKARPALYRLVFWLCTVNGTIGLLGLLGHLPHQQWMMNWHVPNSASITSTAALAIICLAVAIALAFAPTPIRERPAALRLIFYGCLFYPFFYGGYFTIYQLSVAHFDIMQTVSGVLNLKTPPFLTGLSFFLTSISVFSFSQWRHNEQVVVYVTGFLAIIIFNITLFVLADYFKQLPPMLYFIPTFPTAAAIIISAITLLIGTLSFKGLLIPFISQNRMVIFLSTLSILGGAAILLKEVLNISTLHQLGINNTIVLSQFFFMSVLTSIVLSSIFIIISLRALYNYDIALQRAHIQKKQNDAETLLRRIGEIIHSNSPVTENCKKVIHILCIALNCDYALIACVNKEQNQLIEPICEYDVPANEDLKLSNEKPELLISFISEVCNSESPVELDLKAPTLTPSALAFLESGQFISAFVTPILGRTGCIGGLILAQRREHEGFSRIEKHVIRSTVEWISNAIAHSDLLGELKRKEAQFQKILEANIIGVFFWRPDGSITFANQAFLDIVGYHRSDFEQNLMNWRQLDHLEEKLGFRKGWEFEEGQQKPVQAQLRKKNGQMVEVLISSTTLSSDFIAEGVSFVVDITPLKQIENALLEKNKELEKFASIVSHDLQAPLRKIKAFLSLLKEDAEKHLTEGEKDYIDRIHSSASRMQQLVGDLLSLARVTRSEKPFELVDMREVLHEVLHDLAVEVSQKEAVVELKDILSIEADRTQMYQLMQNLLSNSLKYQKKDQPLHIVVKMQKTAGNRCQIIVEDNGIGFDPEKAEWIFGVFTRLQTSDEQKGTGIGLAICRKILERHHGRIWATSSPGKGSIFIAELPIRQPRREFLREWGIEEKAATQRAVPDE